jgi:hypothetical protein
VDLETCMVATYCLIDDALDTVLAGALEPGVTTSVLWSSGPTITLSIPDHTDNRVHIAYGVLNDRDGPIPVQDRIRLTRTPCTFGGSRVWFTCAACSTRCAVLYHLGGSFLCRGCHRLAYFSTRARG